MQQQEMERSSNSDQVVLILDQQNPRAPSMAAELKDQTSADDQKVTQNPARTKTLRRLSFSKPKSRLAEFNHPPAYKIIPESGDMREPVLFEENPSSTDDDDNESWDEEEDDDDDGDRETRKPRRSPKKKRKLQWRLLLEWVLFITIMTCLICSLTLTSLKNKSMWGLVVWNWCLMVMVTFSGRLVSGWVIGFFVFLIERNFMLREKVLYFVYGLRKSIQNCVWLGLVLLAWTLMFNAKVHKENKMLEKVFQALVAVLVAATIWLVKIILVKMMASSFHVATYFDRMKESVFHHYILEALSGQPLMDEYHDHQDNRLRHLSKSMPGKWKEEGSIFKSKKLGSRKMDLEKLRKLSMQKKKMSTWSVKRLINYVRSTKLSTISNTVDGFGKAESEISSEWEARSCARRIFKNVAKPGAKYIEEEDLMRFLMRVEIHTIFPLFEGALETGRISKSSFRNWVVRAYFERKALAHSLNDTKTAVQQLHKLASSIVIVIIFVVFLLVMELANSKVVLFVITQLVLLGFAFQNTCKTIFESIIFVFIMHPFDIGDRCVVEGVQMVVEEMNILTTVFLRYDNEKIYYPNSVLLTKPISNFYRSPEMVDGIDFSIDASTSMEVIISLKKAIQAYLESKPNYWNPKHSVIVKEIENVNKLKMCLAVQHTINHQNYGERNNRVTELILELKKMFETLDIKYRLLPQEVHLNKITDH
ncbi:mechanosensitive ion channel protein 10-like [Corylus avellana]|uniref:mechanosensitive ion channel protein 10-like n=1 Tax=Corylus avellana TaxID=13451 RepID=UPI001E209608|nr:mechanosensitive ion channel protein 10-like [Corylus avellana]